MDEVTKGGLMDEIILKIASKYMIPGWTDEEIWKDIQSIYPAAYAPMLFAEVMFQLGRKGDHGES